MSASETGDEAPLVHFLSSVRNMECASSPASRTVSFSNLASRPSASAKRQSLDAHCRRVDAIAEFQIVRDRHRFEYLEEVAGDGHLAHRIGDLAVLDPEARRAATVIAGDAVDAGTDQVGDIKALLDVADQLFRAHFARLEMQIIRPRRGRG